MATFNLYSKDQTDTLLSAKQNTLVAGSNITIGADGVTISAAAPPVTSVNGATGAVVLTATDIGYAEGSVASALTLFYNTLAGKQDAISITASSDNSYYTLTY